MNLILIDVLDADIHVFRVASIRLCNNFSFEVYDRGFEYKLWLYGLA